MKKKIILFMFLAIITLIIAMPTYALSPSSNEIYQGIDISEWQGNINFEEVKKAGIDVVYIRAGQGFSYKDAMFEKNYEEAKKNGLKIGVYHYVTARSVEDAKLQAKFFVSLISNKKIDCKLAMDFETFGNLDNSEINEVALAYLKELEELSKKEVIVYSNTYSAKYKFNSKVAQYPLWVAQYGLNEPQDNGKWKNWEGFQYSSTGKVSGIKGNVDLDKFTKNIFLSNTEEIPEVEKPNCNKEDRILYKVQKGDTLWEIAQKHNTTVSHLVQINNIKNPNMIYVGEILTISCNHNANSNNNNQNIINYKVQRGDTLSEIALKYNTTISSIVNLNNIQNPNLIYIGQVLKIMKNNSSLQAQKSYYVVNAGNTLWGISRRYNTTVANLVRLNGIKNPNLIYVGEKLRIK